MFSGEFNMQVVSVKIRRVRNQTSLDQFLFWKARNLLRWLLFCTKACDATCTFISKLWSIPINFLQILSRRKRYGYHRNVLLKGLILAVVQFYRLNSLSGVLRLHSIFPFFPFTSFDLVISDTQIYFTAPPLNFDKPHIHHRLFEVLEGKCW